MSIQQSSALERFERAGGREEEDPIERLRFFCSQAMGGQDWLDVEPFFDAVIAERVALASKLVDLEEQEPVIQYSGRRLTPEGTTEVWGYLCGEKEPKKGQLLFTRPAPVEEGIVTVTTDETGRCVMVSRQDEDHRILSVIWQAEG